MSQRVKNGICLVALGLVFATTASAEFSYKKDYDDAGALWLTLGFDPGFQFTTASNLTGGSTFSGFDFDFRVGPQLYFRDWILEGTAYYFNSYLNGSNSRITTRAGGATLHPRFRFSKEFSVGPFVDLLYGTDVSFAASTGPEITSWFVGVGGFYEFFVNEVYRMKLGLYASTDLSISDRQVFTIAGAVHLEIPVRFKSRTEPAPEPVVQQTPPTVIYKDPEPAQIITLDEEVIHFETNKAILKSDSRSFLMDFGAYMAQNNEMWDSILIEGHADKRGRFDRNMKLSKERAASVRQAMIDGGAMATKLRSEGFGPTHPIDPANNERAWAKNRRVELKFFGVADPTGINAKIQELRNRYFPR